MDKYPWQRSALLDTQSRRRVDTPPTQTVHSAQAPQIVPGLAQPGTVLDFDVDPTQQSRLVFVWQDLQKSFRQNYSSIFQDKVYL